MERFPPIHIDLDLDADEDLTVTDGWSNGKTARIDFERHPASCEARLVFGYLTMEQHGAFEELTFEEQQ